MMHFESKPETSKGIAIFTATFASILIYFAAFVASGFVSVLLLVFGLALFVVTVVAATAAYSVSINGKTGLIVKEFSSRVVSRKWRYRANQYSSVCVLTGGRGAFGEGTVVYCAALGGVRTLRITSWYSKRNDAQSDAEAISDYLGIPLKHAEK